MSILVYADDDALRSQLAGKAATLGDVLIATNASLGLPDGDSTTVALGLAEAAKASGAKLVLIGSTWTGKDAGPRTAAHLNAAFATDIQDVEADGEGWKVARMVLSGNSRGVYSVKGTLVATVTAKTFELEGTGADAPAVSVAGSPVTVVEQVGKAEGDFDLSSAPIVVGVGRGFKAQDDIQLARDLAAKFPGGVIGCSRPIAADLKWLGEEYWIGLSGNEVKGKAYIAVGVSGQIQHVAGIRSAKLIIAVNTNKDAPIFATSDYGIVGDLYDVLPKLTAAL